MPGTRKLGRPTDQRMAMLRGMVTYLFENGRIETTLTRAKEVSALADKMITLGKKNTLASYRQALAFITKEDVAHNLFSVTAPKYAKRAGGYTRIYKLGPRRGDGAEMALIEFVETDKELEKPAKKAPAKKSGSTSKRTSARKTAPKAAKTTAPEQAEADAAEAVAADVVAAAEETVDAAPAAAEETAAAAATEAESAGETAAVEQPAEETAAAQPAEDEKA